MSIVTANAIDINADPISVFDVAQHVSAWPTILPHYRYVNVLYETSEPQRQGRILRVVHMGASRSGIPVTWTAVQEVRPDELVVAYTHVAGVTRGMRVGWYLEASSRGCHVQLDHVLDNARPWLRGHAQEFIVGRVFVAAIADLTLAGIKRYVEARHGAEAPR